MEKEIKVYLFIDYIMYVAFANESPKLPELFSKYNKVIAHKVNTQKLVYKNIYKADMIPIKIPAGYLRQIHKIILEFIWQHYRSRITKTILKKIIKNGKLTLLDFKSYPKAAEIKIVRW